MVKAARVNTNPAPAIALTNTPAPVPEKAAPAPPAAANTRLAPVHLLTHGHQEPANAPQLINIPARAPATPVVPAPPAAASIRLALAPLATSGTGAVARNKSSTAPKASCIIATARWLVYVLRVWASMLR